MSRLNILLGFTFFLLLASPAQAFTSPIELTNYTTQTLNIIISISTVAATLFLVKGGYLYLTSTGRPESLEEAKKTIRNALVGLVIVLSAGMIISVFQNALTTSTETAGSGPVNLTPINTAKPNDGLTQVLIDAVSGFMQNLVQSSTKPIVDGIIGYLASTPNLLTNSVVFNFWLVSLGIVDSLFIVVVALLGLHFMSATALGFEEIELRHILPRIGLAFLGANISLFLADYVIITCNALVKTVLSSTGGLHQAWLIDASNPTTFITGNTPLVTLVFLIIFLIVAIVLLFMYISRLIMISLTAVVSPFVFLLWTIPKFSDFAEICAKTYLVTVFMVFVHVVVIQLAASFLTLPGNSNNSLVSISIAIGLFITLLKVPSLMMQMVSYTSRNSTFKKLGNQIINVISNSSRGLSMNNAPVTLPRKNIP